ncbi:MAG TPA: glycoside hydrolase 43 family protein [Ferruginibacter sp.]|nr:glycoside hydrolase 43 family protein [Ferruginibacter sp.]HMP20559.1 glycoside hydrolase 43 family protein [Ferruginibacter sp.]
MVLFIFFTSFNVSAQVKQVVQSPQPATYRNPVLYADYSDPDVIRVGEDYYMTASSFNCVPGLPLLHSKDMVHWRLIGYALQQLQPTDVFDKAQHGNGVWAPAIRYHKGEFYIYYPDPDRGIFLIKAKNITGPWSAPVLVEAGRGLIDPCPLWDEDGKNYLVHAYAGSRAGFKSIIVVKELNTTADKVTSAATLVYDGNNIDPTIEGPKFYKRNGYYYIFAPAGGVSTGWQVVLRSRKVTGPYERKVVMAQGNTDINGPHQGAWVQAPNGEDWFLHFQDEGAYGRIVHLQPMQWKNDWPVIGIDADGDGIGEPVAAYRVPFTAKMYKLPAMPESDEFNENGIGLQWQWHANPQTWWAMPYPARGVLRMNTVLRTDSAENIWPMPNLLLQKLPAETFEATVKLSFSAKTEGERFGFVMMGINYAFLSAVKRNGQLLLTYNTCFNADKDKPETEKELGAINGEQLFLKISVEKGAKCSFWYSANGTDFKLAEANFAATPGKWIGAKLGLFCSRIVKTNDGGYADIDWFRIERK